MDPGAAMAVAATGAGLIGAGSSSLQALRMRRARSAEGVSLGFLCVYLANHAIWLLYGLSRADLPLVTVSGVGAVVSGLTVAVAISLLRRPLTPAGRGDTSSSTPRRAAAPAPARPCGCS